jgi:hypothetical protein
MDWQSNVDGGKYRLKVQQYPSIQERLISSESIPAKSIAGKNGRELTLTLNSFEMIPSKVGLIKKCSNPGLGKKWRYSFAFYPLSRPGQK